MAGTVKPKQRCCQEVPRCKRCPVVLQRLEKRGLATRRKKGYRLSPQLAKKQLRAARARA